MLVYDLKCILYFVFVKVTKRKRRGLGVAPVPLQIAPLFSGYVDEIVWSGRVNETYVAKPSSGTISFTVFY